MLIIGCTRTETEQGSEKITAEGEIALVSDREGNPDINHGTWRGQSG